MFVIKSHGDVQNVNYDVVVPGKNREVKTDALGNKHECFKAGRSKALGDNIRIL